MKTSKSPGKKPQKEDHSAKNIKTKVLIKIFENMVLGADNAKLKEEIKTLKATSQLLQKTKNSHNVSLLEHLEKIRVFEE